MKKLLTVMTMAVLTAGTVLLPAQSVTPAARAVQISDSERELPFKGKRAYSTISQLSEAIGPRIAGTAAEKKSALLIASTLRKLKLDVKVQRFGIPDRLEGTLSSEGRDILLRAASGSAPTEEKGLTAPLYNAGLGYPKDFTADAKGKIALIARGDLTFYEKAKNAEDAGAKAVIIYNNKESLVPVTPNLSGNKAGIPVVGIKKEDGEALTQQKEATLKLNAFANQTSQNIIGIKKPKNIKHPDIVYVTAHYDSVPFSPGANDNGSGTSVMLEMARVLKSIPSDKEIRFIAFGAEELGLLGSSHYVDHLSEKELKRSEVNFNLDMVGTSWENASELYVNTLDGQSNAVWESSHTAADKIGFDSLSLTQGGSSDHVPFHEAGIDSANFIWGDPETEEVEPWYHTPEDSIEHISKERLQQAGDLVTAAVYQAVKKEKKPKTNKKQMKAKASDIYEDIK
ncbi:aminopeptidase YwaD [Bacillus inaquosorum]|uniref:aminopeptidase YwaD n=1 Tax=Bacillus inaquosorum TaxID=483913 RepID=UPI0011E92783|nr:aminopeptidase YwaD [Bacillus inaquosorum]MCY8386916.1 aminopeptidase YwaD [Bacillus inaquosorum]MED1173177.1 aminopeptidase YwaD [Bacillus inaquosorum]MED1540112.1 aminopeptidase YwaD [Bacillus inaquosorum]TYS23324.1 aminopeptidase YwaD [Bacillus subtilis]